MTMKLSYKPKMANKPINHELLANQSELKRVTAQLDELLAALKAIVYCPDYRNVSTHERRNAIALMAKIEGKQI